MPAFQAARPQVTFQLTMPQWRIFQTKTRHRIVIAGRRFGKSVLASVELLNDALSGKDRVCVYVAPSLRQAKQILWKALKKLADPWIRAKNESDMTLELINGSIIYVRGAENGEALRGLGIHFLVLDEVADIEEEIWTEVLFAALSDKGGRCLMIGTPAGMNWVYDLFQEAQTEKEWTPFQFTTEQGGNVPLRELEYAKRTLPEKVYLQEYCASFETLSGRVYVNFDRKLHMDASIKDLGTEIIVGMDFNVDPMTVILASRAGKQLHVWDEIELSGSNTDEMAGVLKDRFPGRRLMVYPDPSGKARKTSANGETDFTILRRAGFTVISPDSAPLVRDRINLVNSAFKAGNVLVSPRCKSLIKSMEGLTYRKGANDPDKSLGLDHIADAFGYPIVELFPLHAGRQKARIAGI